MDALDLLIASIGILVLIFQFKKLFEFLINPRENTGLHFTIKNAVRLKSIEAFGSRPVEVIFGFEKDATSVLHSEHFFRVGTIIMKYYI